VLEPFAKYASDGFDPRSVGAEAALRIDQVVRTRRIVNWAQNSDVQNRMKNDIEDYLCDLRGRHHFGLTFDDIDRILEQCLDIARLRCP
jgi:hypothetical protein